MAQAVSERKRRKNRRALPPLSLCHACRKGRAWKVLMGKKARIKRQKKRKKSGKRPTNHLAMRKWWVHFLERLLLCMQRKQTSSLYLNMVFRLNFYAMQYLLNSNITCAMATSPVCPGYCKEEAAKTLQPVRSTSRRTIKQVGKPGEGGLRSVNVRIR